jgi:hypothetical protein
VKNLGKGRSKNNTKKKLMGLYSSLVNLKQLLGSHPKVVKKENFIEISISHF